MGRKASTRFWGIPLATRSKPPPFRHFARFGEREAVSQYPMTSFGIIETKKELAGHNAASTYVTTREAEAIVEAVTRSFGLSSLDEARAALYTQLATGNFRFDPRSRTYSFSAHIS